jgi:ABC-type multidrug transport system fused ATPase/permease subunit
VWVVLLIVQGLLPTAMVLLVRGVVDALVAALGGAGDIGAVVPPAAALATVFLLSEVLSSVATWVRTAQSELVPDHIDGLIHDQAARLDLGFYETPKYYDKLPEGYGTVLGKWFGGAELSVGEWQRIALARAFLRRASLIVLDEPTSAMDAWAEGDWMSRFRDLVAGSTALVITHRFTTARRADVIHVMGDGRIVDSGSHPELLERGGRYARAWQEQMRSGESCAIR